MMVVFPAPFGPRSPSTSPGWTSKETSVIALVRPKRLLTPATSTPPRSVTPTSGLVVGELRAHPLSLVARGDRGAHHERAVALALERRPVLPLDDREAVVLRCVVV